MEHRTLGRTGITVSLAGLGTGGANSFGQSRGGTAADARDLVRTALDLGVTYFDTAPAYRDSEDLLGAALDGVPRSNYVLASKYQPVGRDRQVLSAAEVDASLRRSLTRLRTDVIDVFQIHALKIGDYDAVVATHLPVLRKAVENGLIRSIGVTESFAGDDPHHETLIRALDDDIADVIMVGYNVVHQNAESDVLPKAVARNAGVVVMAAVRRALASRENLEALIAELKQDGSIARDAVPDADPLGWLVHDGTPSVPAACYRYVSEPASISNVLTGTFDRGHLTENVAALELGPLPETDRDRLRATLGHLDSGLGR